MRQTDLYNAIMAFEMDDPDSALLFTDRLARENGWNYHYAVRAINEYKKFIFLLCISETALTPSEQVDQVWHLHLLYTRSYWIDFCEHTLGKQIHHGPTKGGKEEGQRFRNCYADTLNFYQETFLQPAPADIWPDEKARFALNRFQWVNRSRYWLLKKPSWLSHG